MAEGLGGFFGLEFESLSGELALFDGVRFLLCLRPDFGGSFGGGSSTGICTAFRQLGFRDAGGGELVGDFGLYRGLFFASGGERGFEASELGLESVALCGDSGELSLHGGEIGGEFAVRGFQRGDLSGESAFVSKHGDCGIDDTRLCGRGWCRGGRRSFDRGCAAARLTGIGGDVEERGAADEHDGGSVWF